MSDAWLTRRALLQGAGAAALVLPLRLAAREGASPARFEPNAFLRIAADDTVTLVSHRSEMGQRIRTTLAMVLCDELDADWSRVRVERADGDSERFGDQNTVGDGSLMLNWTPLRTAAAAARLMLVAAASERLALPSERLRTADGKVFVQGQPQRSLRYGELAEAAARQAVPKSPPLKPRDAYRVIGTSRSAVDLRAQTTGRMVYGLDVQRPGQQVAMIVRAPLPAAKLKSFDADASRRVPGVTRVLELPARFAAEGSTPAGVAVVARDTWSCLKARRVLKTEWDLQGVDTADSAEIRRRMEAACDRPGTVYRSGGDVQAARAASARVLSARYWTPFLTHATLEPPNCTADVRADRAQVWAPTQNPGEARERIAAALGLPPRAVTVNVTDIGGGYGRKSMHDFVLEAVHLSRACGTPVKLVWTREDDLRHGYYRSASVQSLEAGLDAQGGITFWRHHSVHSSQQASSEERPPAGLAPYELASSTALRWPYAMPAVSFEGSHVETPLRRSWMRGVQDAFHAFAANCFLDEVAAATQQDPLQLRLQLLGPPRRLQFYRSSASTDYWQDTGRMAAVLRRAGESSDWRQPLPSGRGRGIAMHVQSGTTVAMVAEVRRTAEGFQVERMLCVVDCGLVVNPDAARAQVEGAIVYGLSSCLFGEITLGSGGVQQGNFHDYPVARIGDTPRIEVDFIDSDQAPSGLGEPCVPLVAPAIANAAAAAGAGRLRDWPLRPRA